MDRREFLGQLAIALSIAGIAHTIPAQAFAPEPETLSWPEWDEIVIPSHIKGLAIFRQFLVIATLDGVFLAPAHGVGRAKFRDDHLFVKLAPEVRETFYIEAIGDPPYRLRNAPADDLAVVRHPSTGNYIFWSKNYEASSW